MKKNQNTILLVVIGILVAVSIILSYSKSESSVSTLDTEDMSSMCYLYTSESNDTNPENVVDKEYIELTTDKENMASGVHYILPAGEKGNRASLLGVTDGEYVNVMASYPDNNTTYVEQRVYKIIGDNLYVGYQPVYVPRYKNEHGIFMYEDINKLVFDTDEFFLSNVDCATVPPSSF